MLKKCRLYYVIMIKEIAEEIENNSQLSHRKQEHLKEIPIFSNILPVFNEINSLYPHSKIWVSKETSYFFIPPQPSQEELYNIVSVLQQKVKALEEDIKQLQIVLRNNC